MGLFDSFGPPRKPVKVITSLRVAGLEPHWLRGLNHYQARSVEEMEAIERDNAGWWLREFALARWAADTVFPQAIERRLAQISRKPYAQPETRR